MSSYLVVLGIFLAGQVNSASERYGASGQSPPTNNSSANAEGAGLVPVLDTPAATDRTQVGQEPVGHIVDPYRPSAAGSRSQQTQPGNAAAPPAGQPASVKPSALMRAMLAPPRESRLTGEPVSLAEVIAGAPSRAEQLQRIDAYWDLCASVADYYLGLGELDELRTLRSTVLRTGPTWEQAEKELAVRISTSERAARAAQYRLASWSGQLAGLPLPGDMPHCGNYHSRYQEIFAGRPSAEAQELSALLPLRYAELKDAATAVTRAEEWLNTIASMRNEESDGTGTLRALELWALRRRAFVQIARDYNRRISRYCELSTPGQLPAEQLIGMLIRRDGASTATRSSSPALPPNRQSNAVDSARSTFAGGWLPAGGEDAAAATRDEAVEPASAETQDGPRKERSLLVKPR